jgi:hypothetical protein
MKTKLGADHSDTLASMTNLASSYAAAGRIEEALNLNEETLEHQKAKLGNGHAYTLKSMYNMACFHALMIPKSSDGAMEADRAMEWLKQAVAAGYKDVELFKKDTDLETLRQRDDFKKLLAELTASNESTKKP